MLTPRALARKYPLARPAGSFVPSPRTNGRYDAAGRSGGTGRRGGLKLRCPQGLASSNLASGTTFVPPETAWHMSRAGNSHLRAAAYRMGRRRRPAQPGHRRPPRRKRAAGKRR